MSNSASDKEDDQKTGHVPPSVDTSKALNGSNHVSPSAGSSEYNSDVTGSDSDYGSEDDGSPPDLTRPKTPAHNLRTTEADAWTHEELDQMQTGMIAELSRLLSTADLNDPMLDQLNMAVVTPRAGPMSGHHKTSTMDSIFSFMSNDSEAKDDRGMGFFAIDPSSTNASPETDENNINGINDLNSGASKNIDNIIQNDIDGIGSNPTSDPTSPRKSSKLKSKSMGSGLMRGGNSNGMMNGINTNAPQRGTDEYQNKTKMQVDKTIEKISSSVDEVISKLEKDKNVFSKKTKDKNGKKVLTKKNKEIVSKLTLYQESLQEIHDSLEDFEKMIDEFEYDTVLHKQQFEYNVKRHYETKYETERQIMELELQNANDLNNRTNKELAEDWRTKERVKFDLKLKEEMKLYKKSIKEQYRVRIKNLQKKLKLNEEKKRKEYKDKIMASFEVIVRERIRKMEDEKKLKMKLLQKQKTKEQLKNVKKEKSEKQKLSKEEKKLRAKELKEKSKQYR